MQCLDANQPLPDKYRFLLFEDKQKVELVWNGKTNEVGTTAQGSLFDERGRQLEGWTNKLIWGE